MSISNKDLADTLRFLVDRGTIASYPRDYLGMSQLGHSCARYLWYYFRWADLIKHKPRDLRIFQAGHDTEAIIVSELRRIGIKVSDQQLTVKDANGHIEGHVDGIVCKIPDCGDEAFLLEAKSMKVSKWKSLVANGVKVSNKGYYCQGVTYANKKKVDRIILVVLNKDTSEIHFEVFKTNAEDANLLLDRGFDIIMRNVPPIGISEDPDYFECNWCDFKEVCHFNKNFNHNCRTCVNSRIGPNKTWYCIKHNKVLTLEEQKEGCKDYIMLVT